MKTGLFFGTFNPIHIGHLIIADFMANFTDLNRVVLVVSPHNPLKSKKSLAGDHDRLFLVKLAIESNPALEVTDIEFSMPRPSFTVDTLAHLSEKFPNDDFTLIMGEDNLRNLHKWKNYPLILNNHRIFVYPRMGSQSTQDDIFSHKNIAYFGNMPILYLSATEIRERIKTGRSVRYLLPDAVIDEIERAGMYR